MLEFTTDIKEAGLIFEEYGYYINAMPKAYGKRIQDICGTDVYLTNFSAKLLNDKLNFKINHFLSNTISLDIDNITLGTKLFKEFNMDLIELMHSTTSWSARTNSCKIIFRRPNGFKANFTTFKTVTNNIVIELKGAPMYMPVTKENLGNYFDLAPPSIHVVVSQPYKFISKLIPQKQLPIVPDSIIDFWLNFSNYETKLKQKIY